MNRFDSLRQKVFNAATTQFGDDATWAPSVGGEPQTAKVLFNDPTNLEGYVRQGQHEKGFPEFNSDKPFIEYLAGDFPGLKEAVEEKKREVVTINGIQYRVTDSKTKWDGKNIFAILNKINT